MMEFSWPWAFLLLPLPWFIYRFIPPVNTQEPALSVPFFERIVLSLGQHQRQNKTNLAQLALLSAAWIALVAAAARPQQIGDPIALPTSGRDLMLAVDISGSMSTADMVVNNQQIPRLLIVKYIVGEFLEKREGDRVGLILFGTNAYLQAPLTFDLKTVNTFLQEATLRLAGEKTAIGDAIGLAVKRLKDRPESQRVLILLTDGENTAGNVAPRQAADLAQQAGVKIYTVGVGADKMQVRGGFLGNYTQTINPSSELDEDTLRYIADTTGGQYFRARDPEQLQNIYQKLDEIEAIAQDKEFYRPTRSLYYYPLLMSMVFVFILLASRLRTPPVVQGDL